MTLSAWEKFNKENEMYPVGQQADLHTKKKGAASPEKKVSTVRGEVYNLQEQIKAAMLREIEHKQLLRECREFIQATDAHVHGFARRADLLEKLKAVV